MNHQCHPQGGTDVMLCSVVVNVFDIGLSANPAQNKNRKSLDFLF